MEFRMLGPVEVARENRPVPLGGPKQRAVLAMLVTHANEVVSVDRLADVLWGDAPPADPSSVIHVYVSNLRKKLGKDFLQTRRGMGYIAGADATSTEENSD